ncbi:MAG: thioredoxin [Ectothiorhodospiraceae bacterium]|nr:thioredoxin [Ectothiorhodospiraceae bacterium]
MPSPETAARRGRYRLFVKRDCPTCTLLEPVYADLLAAGAELDVLSQDDPTFPDRLADRVRDDRDLEQSFRNRIETVPTLIRLDGETEMERTVGWDRDEWRRLTGLDTLGESLPPFRPGCGSRSVEPGMAERLAVRFGELPMRARRIELTASDDAVEAAFERGWSDGLPVVPPTELRVLRMLGGTTRDPAEVLGRVPPNLAECTVEKVAINAVMAGCKPEYLPVVLAAVEAALEPAFCMHGLLCTTYFSAPVVIVNGPVARRIGMNCGTNALGQGNRANATIGRALQLVVRNVGGGIPGGIDRATLGTPGKYTFCFAEDESDPSWEPLAVSRGIEPGKSAVTLFGGDGVLGNFDQLSRTPESLTASLAMSLVAIGHPKKFQAHDAFLVLSPEHYRIYREAGWSRGRILDALIAACERPGEELVRGAGGVAEGMPASVAGQRITKFRPAGLGLVRAGGIAGLMSAIIGGWAATGERGSEPVTKEIRT